MMWGNYGMGLWWWASGGLVLVGVVILVVVLVRVSSTSRRRSTVSDPDEGDTRIRSPKQILDARYAMGEMTSEKYRERLVTLGLEP